MNSLYRIHKWSSFSFARICRHVFKLFYLNAYGILFKCRSELEHRYTCLIYLPRGQHEGGELVFRHPTSSLYDIRINPAAETNYGQVVMVIFPIDMSHEVLPITRGTRWVLKRPLFVRRTAAIDEAVAERIQEQREMDDLCDGGEGWLRNCSGNASSNY